MKEVSFCIALQIGYVDRIVKLSTVFDIYM